MTGVAGLLARLDVDPNSGTIIWKRTGKKAGSRKGSGYQNVMVDKKSYLAHRIVWAAHYGEFPAGHIDHINGVRDDNRIANLRVVTPAENQKNTRLDRRNTSGVSGVRFREDRKLWEASIRVGGKLRHLGRFVRQEQAILQRRLAESFYGFHANHGDRKLPGAKDERTMK